MLRRHVSFRWILFHQESGLERGKAPLLILRLLHSSLQLALGLSHIDEFVAVIHGVCLQEERNGRFLIQRIQRFPLKMGDFRDAEDDLLKARRIRCNGVCDLTDDPVDLRVIRVNDDAREQTIVMKPVCEKR